MGFEVDILEREERYKVRLNRTLTLLAILVAIVVGTGWWMLHQQSQRTQKAEAEAAEAAQLAELRRLRAAYASDSLAAATRLADFIDGYKAASVPGATIYSLPLPAGSPLLSFMREAWNDYTLAIDPEATPADQRHWFRRYYVDVMNDAWYNSAGNLVWQGEQRPTAVLVPEVRQKGTELEILKATFPQIVRAQEGAGIRVLEEPEEMNADSSLAQTDTPDSPPAAAPE